MRLKQFFSLMFLFLKNFKDIDLKSGANPIKLFASKDKFTNAPLSMGTMPCNKLVFVIMLGQYKITFFFFIESAI